MVHWLAAMDEKAAVVHGWASYERVVNCWFFSSVGLDRVSFVRAPGDTPRRVSCSPGHALGGSLRSSRGSKLSERGSIQSGVDQSNMFGIFSIPTPPMCILHIIEVPTLDLWGHL